MYKDIVRPLDNYNHRRFYIMLIYENLNSLSDEENATGVNTLSYVALGCNR